MQKLNKTIFSTLFFSIFAAVTGVGIVVPLLPVYAHSLGAGGLYIAMIFGVFSLARTVLIPYFGRLSDRKGRKPFIITGLFGYAIISMAFILSRTVESLIIIRMLQGIASAMMMPVIQAYVGDITPKGREGLTMGMFNMAMFFGLSIGPLIGGVINEHLSMTSAFLSMGSLSLVGFLLCLFLLPPTRTEKVLQNADDLLGWSFLLKNRDILGLCLFRFGHTVCIGIIWGFLPVFADSKFNLSSSAIGILIMLGVFTSGLIHVPMGYLADRLNKKILVVAGGLVASTATLTYALANGFWHLIVVSVIFGLGGGIAMPALMSLAVIKGNQIGVMGTVMALMTTAHSLGMLTGAFLAGVMMDFFHLDYVFPLGAFSMVGTVFLFVFWTRHSRFSH
jgi:MFS family permease